MSWDCRRTTDEVDDEKTVGGSGGEMQFMAHYDLYFFLTEKNEQARALAQHDSTFKPFKKGISFSLSTTTYTHTIKIALYLP